MSGSLTYLASLCEALHQAMVEDATVLALGEDILDPYGGAFKVTQGLSTRFPARVFTTPICEASIVGMSVGLALRGYRPVAEIMFGDFVTLAADQLINHAAKYPAMYNGQVQAPLVVRTPMGGGRGYGPTHSQSLERLFLGIPHLHVVAASHWHDAGALLRAAIADPVPVLFVENKLLYPVALELQPAWTGADGERYPTVLARNFSGDAAPDVTIIGYGGASRLLATLLPRLAAEEIRVLACLPALISPLHAAPLVAAAAASGRVLVVEESQSAFGWGAEVAALLSAVLPERLAAPVRRLGAAPTVIPAAKALEEALLLSAAAIEQAVVELLSA